MGIFDTLRDRVAAAPARPKPADESRSWWDDAVAWPSNQAQQRSSLPSLMEDLRARAPADAVIDWDQHGSLLTITTTLSREGLHARLVVTCDTAPFKVLTEQLFRWDDGLNPDEVEVTKEAARDGKLRVDWRMPDTLTDLQRLHRIEAPGLLYGFMPFHLTPYLRDQTLGIKNPELRMRGAALQQTLRAISKVNADLVETGVFSAIEGAQGLASLARPAAGAARPIASGADELAEAGAATAARSGGRAVDDVAEGAAGSAGARAGTAAREATEAGEGRLAKLVDPEVSKLVDEAFESGAVCTGAPVRLIGHGSAREARGALGLSGRVWESAHGGGRSIMRTVSGYDPNAALTRLLPRNVHREMDRFWQAEARSLRAQGRTSWTAQEAFDATARSINRTTGLTEAEKFTHIQRLRDEMFVEWGLSELTPVRLPFGP